MDNIETINAKHFSQCILFYKAPSKAVRDRLFDPLRHMSAICLENPEKILDFYQPLTEIIEILKDTVHTKSNTDLDELNKNTKLTDHMTHGYVYGV